ncbi:MAG: beta strand repeat-containing protein [Thermoguttaceae bacterium]
MGSGDLTLYGDNNYTGPTLVQSVGANGKLQLNFGMNGAPNDNIINPASPLVLCGLLGLNGAGAHSQTFNGTTLEPAFDWIDASSNPGITVNLGAITRRQGSYFNSMTPVGGGSITTTSTGYGASHILGFATCDGVNPGTFNWAVGSSNGSATAITGLATYTMATTSGGWTQGADMDLRSAGTYSGSGTINSLRIWYPAGGNPATLNLSGTATITSGGILFVSGCNSGTSTTISGGSLTSGNNQNDLIFVINNWQNYAMRLNVASCIVNNGATPVGITVGSIEPTAWSTGAVSWLVLNNPANSFTGPVSVENAILALAPTANGSTDPMISGASGVYLNNGWLVNYGYDGMQFTISKNITLGPGGGGTDVAFNGDGSDPSLITLSGVISGAGFLQLAGGTAANGLTILTGSNTYTGGTFLGIHGFAGNKNGPTYSNLQIGNGGTTGSILGSIAIDGTPSNYVAFDHSDTVTFPGTLSGVGGLRQIGSGMLVLTGSNTYSGGTTVSAGTLQTRNGVALGFGGQYVPGQAAATTTVVGGVLDLAGATVNEAIVLSGGAMINSSTATAARLDNGVAAITVTSGSGFFVSQAGAALTLSGSGGASGTLSSLGLTQSSLLVSGGSGYSVGDLACITGNMDKANQGQIMVDGVDGNGGITAWTLTLPGAGYTVLPTGMEDVTGYGTGSGASLTAVDGHFCAVGVTTTAPGTGYTTAPSVSVSGGTLAATANLSSLSLVGSNNQIGGAGNLAIPAIISGSGGFAKIGVGILTLSGSNTYSGGTIVESGTLVATTAYALPSGTILTVGAGGMFVFDPSAAGSPVSNSAVAVAVPEPGTLVLLIAGAALVTMYRKRR